MDCCGLCRPYQVPVLYELTFAMGMSSGSIELDPAKLGQEGTANSKVFGRATRILWAQITTSSGDTTEAFFTRSEAVWASASFVNTNGISFDLPFTNWQSFVILLSSGTNAELDITFVLEIDPLKRGAKCSCGRHSHDH